MKVLIISSIVVLIDQISKLFVRVSLEFQKEKEEYQIIGDWVRLYYTENSGMAFGIEFGGQMFFTVFALIMTIIIFIYIVRARAEKIQLRVSLALILGGAIGNLIDRFLYGKVTDFIVVGARWPIFNIADSAVTIGMIILITIVLFDKPAPETEKGKEASA